MVLYPKGFMMRMATQILRESKWAYDSRWMQTELHSQAQRVGCWVCYEEHTRWTFCLLGRGFGHLCFCCIVESNFKFWAFECGREGRGRRRRWGEQRWRQGEMGFLGFSFTTRFLRIKYFHLSLFLSLWALRHHPYLPPKSKRFHHVNGAESRIGSRSFIEIASGTM